MDQTRRAPLIQTLKTTVSSKRFLKIMAWTALIAGIAMGLAWRYNAPAAPLFTCPTSAAPFVPKGRHFLSPPQCSALYQTELGWTLPSGKQKTKKALDYTYWLTQHLAKTEPFYAVSDMQRVQIGKHACLATPRNPSLPAFHKLLTGKCSTSQPTVSPSTHICRQLGLPISC